MAAMRLQSERVQQSPPFVANATHGRNKLSQQHNDSARARRCCTRMVSRASSAGRRRADNPLILSGSVPCIPSAGAFAKHSSSMPGRRLSFAPVRVAPEDGGSHVDDVEEPLLDLKGLKQELSRQTSRAVKKVAATHKKLRSAEEKVAALLAEEEPDMKDLEACPDPDQIKVELQELQQRVEDLNSLGKGLEGVKSSADSSYPVLVKRARELNVGDSPPPRPERGPKKKKQKAPPPRKPYWTYQSVDDIEIRVGRGASDNDQLSCSPEHRDGRDWWMHVAGCPGSHVVIRSQDDDLPEETVRDAAALTAKYSKAPQKGKIRVSLVRCRQVSKPAGAKPGLVQLSGNVETVKLDVKAESNRLERLEESKSTPGLDGA